MAGRNKIRQCRTRKMKNSSDNQNQDTHSRGVLEARDPVLSNKEEKINNHESLTMQNTSLTHQRTTNISEESEESKEDLIQHLYDQREPSESGSKKTDSSQTDELWDYYPKQVQKVLKKKRISKESE